MSASPLSAAVVHRLRQLRLSAGVSVPRLAKRAGLTADTLRRIEGGLTAPSVGQLGQVAAQLGASLADLVHHAKAPAESRDDTRSRAVGGDASPEAIGRAIVALPAGADKLDLVEAAAIRYALEVAKGNKSAAARLLGRRRQQFARRLRRFRD